MNTYEEDCAWGSRRVHLMVMLCQTMSTTSFTHLPHVAIASGAAGHVIGYILAFILVGIPLLYLEYVVSQFTARDCIDIWKARGCLSHIGYVQLLWQAFQVIYNHTVTVFVLHYFLISFENPIPYFVCGPWTTKHCNIDRYNYSVNLDCVKLKENWPHCENLFKTYPVYQYWRFYILGGKEEYYYVAWRVCLASAISCAVIYFSCFKRKTSIKWFIHFFIIYPTIGYVLLLIGSMSQKGVVVTFGEGLDADFTVFKKHGKVSSVIVQVLFTLNTGTGISFNMGSSASFRAPCYSNVVLTVVACSMFAVLVVCVMAMMTCPYAYEHDTHPTVFITTSMTLLFEKIPRLLKEYEYQAFWLTLIFSCNATLGISTNVIIILSCTEMMARKFSIVDKYSGMFISGVTCLIFFITTPLLGNVGVSAIFDFRIYSQYITIFIGAIESLVFVMWYGLDKFSEDVHFMQGIQPKALMKLAWISSSSILVYVLLYDLYFNSNFGKISFATSLGWWCLMGMIGAIIVIAIVKLVVAGLRRKFSEVVSLNRTWGPPTEVLLRSRAMFSAQAMTKEYMYRQYHLQAGIIERQKASNIRREL